MTIARWVFATAALLMAIGGCVPYGEETCSEAPYFVGRYLENPSIQSAGTAFVVMWREFDNPGDPTDKHVAIVLDENGDARPETRFELEGPALSSQRVMVAGPDRVVIVGPPFTEMRLASGDPGPRIEKRFAGGIFDGDSFVL